jgi:hypothetical protein
MFGKDYTIKGLELKLENIKKEKDIQIKYYKEMIVNIKQKYKN